MSGNPIFFDKKFSLKYSDDNVPKNHDLSEMQFTFDFIYLVYKCDSSIDKAIRGVALEYGLSESFLMDYLVSNNYLLNKMNKKDYLELIKTYNTKSLKKLLKSHGFKASGKREKIEQKVLENRLIDVDYHLSSKSRIFYKNKKRRVNIFQRYLENYYYFDEFNEYYMDNFRKKLNKIPVDYVNRHINNAFEDKNHFDYVSNLQIKVNIYRDYKNCKKMLENVLKIFCANLNPVWRADDLSNHIGLYSDTYSDLLYLKDKMGKNRIISAYFAVWDSFNFESFIVTKQIGYWYLKDLLKGKDYFKLLDDMDKKYYSNDELKIKKVVQKTLFDF